MKIKLIEVNHPGVTIKHPTKATEGSAGLDLYAAIPEKVTIEPGGLVSIPTGISVEFPGPQYAGFLFARSGLATKHGITLSNSVGVIDSDYTGEIIVGLCNLSKTPYVLEPGERFAQLVIMQLPSLEIEWGEKQKNSPQRCGIWLHRQILIYYF